MLRIMVKKLVDWIKKFFKWLLSHLKDKTTIIIFLILFGIAISPIVLGFVFGFILNNTYLIGIATAYLLFWLAPATPVFTIIIAVTIMIRRIIELIRSR